MGPPFIKTARSALRHLFQSDQPLIKQGFSNLFGRQDPPEQPHSADPTKDGLPTRSIHLFQGRQPSRIDCHYQARSFPGSRNRAYRVFVPSRYRRSRPLPLVMVLHGCHQTHLDIARVTNFDALAEKEGFIAVYPFVSSYNDLRAKNCWGWWLPKQTRAGAGEVEDLKHIIEEVQSNYAIDHQRVHVAGLSSGAGMAVALMVVHAPMISSGCTVAGVAYGESPQAVQLFRPIPPRYRPTATLARGMERQMPEHKHPVPLLIVHSHSDQTVDIKAAKNLRDSWAKCYDISLHRKVGVNVGETGASHWRRTHYRGTERRQVIDTLWLDGPGHGWCGGNTGPFSFPNAIDLSQQAWQFFKSHPL